MGDSGNCTLGLSAKTLKGGIPISLLYSYSFQFPFLFYFLNFVLKLLDLYLSYNTGDDGRSCTLGFACKTLKRASEVWMQADTVFLEAGDYSIFLWEKNRKRKRT